MDLLVTNLRQIPLYLRRHGTPGGILLHYIIDDAPPSGLLAPRFKQRDTIETADWLAKGRVYDGMIDSKVVINN